MDRGCKFGTLRMNIIAYADDIVLIADAKGNLDVLYEALKAKFQECKLNINKKKTKCIIFKRKGRPDRLEKLTLAGDELDVVSEYKYLGHHLQSNLSDIKDIEVRLNAFYAKSNWVLRNFNNVNIETLLYLFNAYCTPDYGLSLWDAGSIFCKQIFKTFETAYSNALKRIIGVPISTSSHAVADCCNKLLLMPHVLLNQARYFKRLNHVTNSVIRMSHGLSKNGYLFNSMYDYFKEIYSIDFASNSMDIIKASLQWVHRQAVHTGWELSVG